MTKDEETAIWHRDYANKVQAAKISYDNSVTAIQMRYEFLDQTGFLPFQFFRRETYDSFLISLSTKFDVWKVFHLFPPNQTYEIKGYPPFICQYIVNERDGFTTIYWFSGKNKISAYVPAELYAEHCVKLEKFKLKTDLYYYKGVICLGPDIEELCGPNIPDMPVEHGIINDKENLTVEIELERAKQSYESDLARAQDRLNRKLAS